MQLSYDNMIINLIDCSHPSIHKINNVVDATCNLQSSPQSMCAVWYGETIIISSYNNNNANTSHNDNNHKINNISLTSPLLLLRHREYLYASRHLETLLLTLHAFRPCSVLVWSGIRTNGL